jgi:protein TonB
MKYAYFFISFLFSVSASAQFNKNLKRVENSDSIAEFKPTSKQAEFPGGIGKLYKYISKHTKLPKDAKEHKVNGKVLVQFVIDSLGNIKKESVKVIKPLFESCDIEAVRVIKNCPAWIPAIDLKTNKNIESRFVLTVFF